MAKTRKSTKSPAKPKNRRGSPEAIEKRKAARRLNTLLDGGGKGASKLDGRTEKRRQRLITELKEGKGGKNLKSMEVLTKVDDLVKLGENFSSLKRAGVKVRRSAATPEIIAEAERVQLAYGFAPEAWKFLGITVGETKAPKKAAPKRKAAKRAARKR